MQNPLTLKAVGCGALAVLLLTGAPAVHAQTAAHGTSAESGWRVAPGTPLADALRTFARQSGYDVVFAEELVRGKTASGVRANASAYETLTRMLAGTGLAPRFTRRDAFIVEAIAESDAPDLALAPIEVVTTPPEVREAEYRWYGEKLLQASLAALRGSGELGKQSYDFTLYVWLSNEGRVVDLDGQGSGAGSEALSKAKDVLTGLLIDAPPPANMPQPVGLRISAQ